MKERKEIVEKLSTVFKSIDIPNNDSRGTELTANTASSSTNSGVTVSFRQKLQIMLVLTLQLIFPLLSSMGEFIVALLSLFIELPFFIVFCVRDPFSSLLRTTIFALTLTSICLSLIDVIIIFIHLLFKCNKYFRGDEHWQDHPQPFCVKYANLFRVVFAETLNYPCLLYTSPSPRDATLSRMPSSA